MNRILILTLFVLLAKVATSAEPQWAARDGLVVIEIESHACRGGWRSDTAITGYTGSGYFTWAEAAHHAEPGYGVLGYRVQLPAGLYRLLVRSRITAGERRSEANDSWLRVRGPEGVSFQAIKGADYFSPDHRAFPAGSGRQPQPQGASREGWFKFYCNELDWSWNTRVGDRDPHQVIVEVLRDAEVLVEFSGRSPGHGVDRFVLFDVRRHSFNPLRAADSAVLSALPATEPLSLP